MLVCFYALEAVTAITGIAQVLRHKGMHGKWDGACKSLVLSGVMLRIRRAHTRFFQEDNFGKNLCK